jgi:predicted amidohydrolase YtcJ
MRNRFIGWFAVAALALALVGCTGPSPEKAADTIYVGGTIVTVNDAQPKVEAVAVKDGKILAVGARADVENANKGAQTKIVDLAGKTMTPGFVDPHGHFIFALDMADQANVSAPPVGPASNPQEIVAALKKFADARGAKPDDLVVGYGYDENLMPKGHPLTRDDIDAVFPNNPVYVIHVSGHGAVLNSKAFAKYGISAATKTPEGGVILRKPGSQEPAGLIMEMAYLPVFNNKPVTTPEQELSQLKFAQDLYAAAGVTTAQEGATHTNELEVLKRAAARNALVIDVVAFPFFLELDPILAKNPASTWGVYNNRLKIGGCKIVSDGSPQGKTAFFTTPYLTGGPSGEKNWKGEPSVPQDVVNAAMKKCYDQGLPVNVHANGDAAIDMAIKAHEYAAAGDLTKDRRTAIIHSQFIRKDQLQKYIEYKLIPSFFTEHTFFFGDTHVLNRGKAQAYFMSPMKTAIGMGLRPTNHTDFNVAPIDQMFVIWTAVNRTSRSGQVIGPDERVSPMDALKAITIYAAYQYKEEGSKGSIEPGKLADLVILSANPLTVQPNAIKDIKVVETIKQGNTIYQAK